MAYIKDLLDGIVQPQSGQIGLERYLIDNTATVKRRPDALFRYKGITLTPQPSRANVLVLHLLSSIRAGKNLMEEEAKPVQFADDDILDYLTNLGRSRQISHRKGYTLLEKGFLEQNRANPKPCPQ